VQYHEHSTLLQLIPLWLHLDQLAGS